MSGFKIEAKVINERIHELVLNGQWPEAIKFMQKSLNGINYEECLKIILGNDIFVDIDGVSVEFLENVRKKTEKEIEHLDSYKREIKRKYSGVLKVKDKYYKPYAIINGYCREDMVSSKDRGEYKYKNFDSNLQPVRYEKHDYYHNSLFYANDSKKDICIDFQVSNKKIIDYLSKNNIFTSTCSVLFEEVEGVFPIWLDAFKNPNDSISDFMENGYGLEIRGASDDKNKIKLEDNKRDSDKISLKKINLIEENEIEEDNKEKNQDLKDKCKKIKEKIISQVEKIGNNPWINIKIDGYEDLVVPRVPFEHWSLDSCGADNLVEEWKICSEYNLKKGMIESAYNADDPLHTDWMIGSGIDVTEFNWYHHEDNSYEDLLLKACYNKMAEIQKEKLNFTCNVLLKGNSVTTGKIYIADNKRKDVPNIGDIVVLPNASPKWFEIVKMACKNSLGGVILEKGGMMSHLVVAHMGENINMVRIDKATKIYKDGQIVSIDCQNGVVNINNVILSQNDFEEQTSLKL